MALEGVRCQRHAPAALYPRERIGTHCTRGWVGPRAGLDMCGKFRPQRDSILWPSSPKPVATQPTKFVAFTSKQHAICRCFLAVLVSHFFQWAVGWSGRLNATLTTHIYALLIKKLRERYRWSPCSLSLLVQTWRYVFTSKFPHIVALYLFREKYALMLLQISVFVTLQLGPKYSSHCSASKQLAVVLVEMLLGILCLEWLLVDLLIKLHNAIPAGEEYRLWWILECNTM